MVNYKDVNMDDDADIATLIKNVSGDEDVDDMSAPSSIGQAVLSRAKADLDAGVKETSDNRGPRIDQYFKEMGWGVGQEWCAAAVSAWMKEAGVSVVSGSLGARNLGHQFESAKRWVPKNQLKPEHAQPGNIPVWSRGPSNSGQGHVGVIESTDGSGNFKYISGNSGSKSDSVTLGGGSIKDGNLIGIGILSDSGQEKTALNKKVDAVLKQANYYYLISKY
jgi:hypothetical protein